MKNRKLGSLFLIAILALAGIGMSYAGFSDTITITGTVSTGTVNLDAMHIYGTWVWKDIENHEIIIHENLETIDGSDPQGFYHVPGYELVSYVTGTVGDPDNDVITVTWHNLFPLEGLGNYFFEVCFQYLGTIPVRIVDIQADYTGEWISELESEGYLTYGMEYPSGEIVDICDQLHELDEFCLWVDVDIIQDNDYQGQSGSASFQLDVIQWNEAVVCDDPIIPKEIIIPDWNSPVELLIEHYGTYPSYWWVTFETLPGGPYSPPMQVGSSTQGWCIDEYTTTSPGIHTFYLLSTLDPEIYTVWPGNIAGESWDYVNYIINHDEGMDRFDVQDAIWYFVDGGNYPTDPEAAQLVDDALADAQDWIINSSFPQPGHWVAVYCQQDNGQNLIIEIDP